MKRYYLALVMTILFSCAFYKAQVPGYFYDDGYYKNTNVGFKVYLPADWEIGTTNRTGPEEFKPIFKNGQTKTAEVLFMGMNSNKRCAVKCITEANDTTLEYYFKELFLANEGNVTTGRADYYRGHGQELVIWSYYSVINGAKFRFNEYIFNPGKLKVRLVFWTMAGLFDDYSKLFDETLKTMYLADTTSDTTKIWNDRAVWVAKDSCEYGKVIDFATDKKELYFSSDITDTICKNTDKSFLWKVTGGQSICYILGSIHILKPEMYPLKKIIESAFDSSTSIVLEINTEDPENSQKITESAKSGIYTAGESIKKDISPQLYEQIMAWVSKRGIPAEKFEKFKPWMASLVLPQLQMKSLGLSIEYGVEKYFLNKKSNKEILELEKIDDQFALLTSLNSQDFLAYTFADIEKTEDLMSSMISAWKCGNTTAFNQITFGTVPQGSEEMIDKLIYSRNKKMAEKIKMFVDKGKKSFVIIGAAHLVGEKSVIDLLQKSGLQVEQL